MKRMKTWMAVKMALLLLLPQKMNSMKVMCSDGVNMLALLTYHISRPTFKMSVFL